MVACLGLVIVQLVNIQLLKAKQLQTSPYNPRVAAQKDDNDRGTIDTADGTVLAQSVPTPTSTNRTDTHTTTSGSTSKDRSTLASLATILRSTTAPAGSRSSTTPTSAPDQQAPQTLSQLLFRQTLPMTTVT